MVTKLLGSATTARRTRPARPPARRLAMGMVHRGGQHAADDGGSEACPGEEAAWEVRLLDLDVLEVEESLHADWIGLRVTGAGRPDESAMVEGMEDVVDSRQLGVGEAEQLHGKEESDEARRMDDFARQEQQQSGREPELCLRSHGSRALFPCARE
ncbi:hypothetical protein PR202_gb24343 [Eleusine coracana subsp. coracana]|uniref:Uncharacterized protein n=1 Tax=Eleusine coracana subsp. coracana TaxID=191504 RepID=A0AAV5FL76_ELECO|nr:hypothetical protein PR202_gb24343 [Eleusine coracana subsp. coracana]